MTATIIDAMETGSQEFEMPWNATAPFPRNARTQLAYRGVNILVLWAQAMKHEYTSALWATYQQWHELGAQVRKGEKSTAVVFWKFCGETEEAATDTETPDSSDNRRCCARAYHVFNATQVDGFEVPLITALPDAERIRHAETFFANAGVRVIEGGSRAYYRLDCDEIHMPPFSAFKKPDYFYSVLGHEAVHAVGHPSRSNRQLTNRFGSEAYAAEELIAELGSAFISAELKLDTEPRADHAPYVRNWLAVLRHDKRAIFTAASKAQEAVDWLLKSQTQQEAV
ncbi:MAG: ArdC family protein [Bryobacteraceae bacterium]